MPVPDIRVLTVCTGNVCRSPAAAVILRRGLETAGIADRVEVQSGGTSWEAAGQTMDERIVLALVRAGYQEPFEHTSRVVHQSEMREWDLVLPMTAEHAQTIRRKVDALPPDAPRPDVHLWGQFDPAAPATAREEDLEVKDPWYSGQKAFDRTVLSMERAVPSIVMHLRSRLRAIDAAR